MTLLGGLAVLHQDLGNNSSLNTARTADQKYAHELHCCGKMKGTMAGRSNLVKAADRWSENSQACFQQVSLTPQRLWDAMLPQGVQQDIHTTS